MSRDYAAVGGCLTVLILFAVLFAMSSVAQIAADYEKARILFRCAIAILVIGAVGMIVLFGVMVWRDRRSIDEGQRAVIERAERLRAEREHARAQRAGQAPTVAGAKPAGPAAVIDLTEEDLSSTDLQQLAVREIIPRPKPIAHRAEKRLAECPVCQTRILQGEMFVTCPDCNTPHHEDCWEYNSGCGRYGCAAAPPA